MQLIGTMPPKQIHNGLVLQLCVKEGCNRFKGGLTGHPLSLDQERGR
jgi:hypothetical protein